MLSSTYSLTRARRAVGLALSVVFGLAGAALLFALAAGRPAYAGAFVTHIVSPGQSIQAAINGASPGDTVQVNPGTYTESLTLSKTVNLVGTNAATTFIQAVAGQRVITVSAPLTNAAAFMIADLTIQGGDVTSGVGCPQNCGGGMLVLTGTASPLLQNLVVRNNTARLGGGVFAGANLTVTGSVFTNNVATFEGGGLHMANSAPGPEYRLVLSNSQFISNTAQNDGGGAFVFGTAIVSNSWFERNRNFVYPARGAGLLTRYLVMTNTSFYSNTGHTGGGGAYSTLGAHVTGGVFQNNFAGGVGGGLAAVGGLSLTGTQFISNTSQEGGGGLYIYADLGPPTASVTGAYFERNSCNVFSGCNGGGLEAAGNKALVVSASDFLSNTSRSHGAGLASGLPLTLIDALFQGNTCTFGACGGGGLFVSDSAVVNEIVVRNNSTQGGGGGAYFLWLTHVTDAVFQANSCAASDCRGGGVRAENSLSLTNTQFISNTSLGEGGGVAHLGAGDLRVVNGLFARNAAGAPGLGLWFASPGSGVVLHTTFANPSATSGAAVVVENGSLGLTNTIVANYAVGITRTSGSVYENYTLFNGVTTATAGGVTSGPNHPTGNPLFANPAADNYRLQAGSPAQDVGFAVGVPTDFEGNPRPYNLVVDLGYDEFSIIYVYLPVVVR